MFLPAFRGLHQQLANPFGCINVGTCKPVNQSQEIPYNPTISLMNRVMKEAYSKLEYESIPWLVVSSVLMLLEQVGFGQQHTSHNTKSNDKVPKVWMTTERMKRSRPSPLHCASLVWEMWRVCVYFTWVVFPTPENNKHITFILWHNTNSNILHIRSNTSFFFAELNT